MNPAAASTTRSVDELDAVARHLGPRGAQQVGRGHPVARQEALHVGGGRVARRAGVDDHDAPPRAAEHERRAQAGGAAADDRHVLGVVVHVRSLRAAGAGLHVSVAVSGTRR